MVGSVCAADSDNINTVTVDGINFTVPDGYIEDIGEEIINESNFEDGVSYTTCQKSFENESDILLISVSTYETELTDEDMADFGKNTTINNITGYLEDLNFCSVFTYNQDGKLVVVTVTNPDVIEEVLS